MNEDVVKIQELVTALKKRWKLICLITVIITILSIITSIFIITPKYETKTKVFIGKEGAINKGVADENYSGYDVEMYQKLLKTYAEVIQTNDLIEKAIDAEGLDLKSKDVLKNLKVTPTTDTQILEINYINKDKVVAKNILDSITSEFMSESKQLIPNGNVKIIESVRIPEEPVSPNKKIIIVISFFTGLMIGIGLSLFLEFLDNTFENKEEMEQELGLPVLGAIPDFINQ
ncbi:Wzz/FepE/Etk N-terminal domain-containing protein [Clostridium sp. BL-8]|uniref:YveK family protein n=1 Tax=Clostridium sp. BL-8 TaxID=349938 RepID=UPI00098CC727|nr:Wzz/FepE/Etk N-terminal domain-containing protein [Clostridium sp. BL-8]OOM79450.1 capsular polysaccharide type 8 biosynthesis protein cap8A [Clostridium sp. BL-8]